MRFKDKVAVVTGGNSGIGLAAARLLAKEGAKVAICGRDEDSLNKLAAEEGFLAQRVDVARIADIDRFYADVAGRLGSFDLLFVNAGIYKAGPLAETTEALFDEIMDINLKGAFFSVQKALPHLKDGSAVVLNSSILNQRAWPGNSIYSATKAGVRSLARSFATDLVERGIRVNTVSPGPTFTPIFGRLGLPDAQLQEVAEHVRGTIPMKRFGNAEEVAQAVLFLGSDQASFITGSELCVDGGLAQI